MKSLLLFISLAFISTSLLSVEVDKTLVQGTVKSYSALLDKIQKKTKKDDDDALQQALLRKLITLSQAKPPQPLSVETPTDIRGYQQLFRQYKRWLLSRKKTLSLISELNDKLTVVKNQLQKIDTKDNSTASLQLQYAFYSKGKEQAEKKLTMYKKAVDAAVPHIIEALKKIHFQVSGIPETINKIEAQLTALDKSIQRDQVERERLSLLEKTAGIRKVDASIKQAHDQRSRLLNEELESLFINLSAVLRQGDASKAFSLQKKIATILAELNQADDLGKDIRSLINHMDIATLGRAATLKGVTIDEFEDGFALFWDKLNAPLMTINNVPVSAFKLVLVLFVLVAGFMIGGLYKRYVKRISFKTRSFTSSTRTLVANLGNYIIIAVAFFVSLKIIGVNLSSIAIVAGALSVGIGFGLQNIVSNFVSGIILLFERSIKIGDYLEIDDKLRGRVTDIRMRSTTISTNANIDVIIPNQDLIQNKVINWTMNDQIRRYEVPFGVAYGTDPQKVVDAVLSAVGHSGFTDIYTKPPRYVPSVIMTGMGDSSVDFLLLVWLKGSKTLSPKRTTSRFLILIYNALNASNIEIPFPQRDLHLRSINGNIPVQTTPATPEKKDSPQANDPSSE